MLNKVFIDFERMKYKHTGLYHFCLNLGQSLLKEVEAAKEQLCFFVPPSVKGIFGDDAKYIKQHDLHKFFLPTSLKFQVWHATHQGTDYYPYRNKVKKVLTIHDINFMHDRSKSAYKRNKYLNALQKKIKKADHITTVSKFVLNDVLKYIDLADKPTSIIYNGCNITEIKELQKPNIVPNSSFLFTIGTIMAKKNFHVLPALLINNDMQLIIAGIVHDDSYKQKIIAEANKYNVVNRIIFTGPISENDKQWYFSNCTAFIFPSLTEGFGLPVIEAMYFGKPVILSEYTSLPEVGGDCAYYFNNFEPEHMQEVLLKSLHHYNTTQAADKIKHRVSLFTWSHAAKQYMDVYRGLYSKLA